MAVPYPIVLHFERKLPHNAKNLHDAVPSLQGWLHPGLSVLMNVTHNNEAGREAVAAGGGLVALAQLVACCAAPALQAGAVTAACTQPEHSAPKQWLLGAGCSWFHVSVFSTACIVLETCR